jgi:hypothetical protein
MADLRAWTEAWRQRLTQLGVPPKEQAVSDLQKQHDELMADVVKTKREWEKAQSQECDAFGRWHEAYRRLNEFDRRNEVIREDK